MKMGRPKKENPNTTSLSFKINDEQLTRLRTYCTLTKKTQGEVIRAAIEAYINVKPDEQPQK